MTMTRFRTCLFVAACAWLTSAVRPHEASAACDAPEPVLVWSYPSDGATGVPTNAVFYALSEAWVSEVLLDGRPVAARALVDETWGQAFVPEGLEPDTEYRLTVVLDYPDTEGATKELSFRTGSGPLSGEGPSVELLDITLSSDPLGAECEAILQANGCYDEGQDARVVLKVDAQAVVYVVGSRHPRSDAWFSFVSWPASCGAPRVYFFADQSACHTVHAFDAAGRVSSSQELCGAASDPASVDGQDAGPHGEGGPRSLADSGGCSVGASRTSTQTWFALVMLLGVLMQRAHRGRAGAA